MNIIIAGDGEVGFHLAKLLSSENHNIIIVDPHEDLLEKIGSQTDLMTITGDSTSPAILQKAGISGTDLLISVVHDECTNIITSILGKKLGAKRTIARIDNPEYLSDESIEMFRDLGIDVMVCPERIASIEVVKLLKRPAATEFFEFSEGRLMLFLIKLDKNAPVVGKSLDQIAAENQQLNFRCIAIHRNSETIIPHGKDKFESGDLAYVITKPDGIKKLLQLGGKVEKEMRHVMIVGGGRIGKKTAKLLEKEVNLKLIEQDPERCQQLAEELRNTLIIKGDARHFELLEEEGLCGMDAFLAMTDDSETNVFTCLIARKYGVERTIALVENIDFIDISQRMGIDTIINKKLITASYIVRYTMGAEVLDTRCLVGVDAEVFEFVAKKGSLVTRKPIKDLPVPSGAIIGGIIRGEEGMIALGSTQIIENDKVVVFSLPEEIHSLARLFN